MHIEGAVAKQLGWEMKDGILVNKQEAEPVPCVCDECGYVADVVPGGRCPECKTGSMKAKGKEKAIEIRSKASGVPCVCSECGAEASCDEGIDCSKADCEGKMEAKVLSKKKTVIFTEQELHFALDNKGRLPTEEELKTYKYVEKAVGIPCACDECGAEDDCASGTPCQVDGCTGVMRPVKGEEKKKIVSVVKVVRPAPSVKVLFVPPNEADIALRVGEAVEKALARRTGKIL
jgi:hypothetical protein